MKSIAMKTSLTTLLCLSAGLPQIVFADDLLNRLENATEAMGKKQGDFYLSRVPELKDKMPEWEWDEEIRQASKCVLDGIEKAKGQDVAEAYVAGLEKDAAMEISSMTQFSEQSSIPEELQGDDQTILNLMESCKTIEISTVRLKQSGFWDAMQDPTVMQRLLAE